MITLTEKDLLRIQTLLREIRQESMRVNRRKYRIYNLCDKVSVILKKSEKQYDRQTEGSGSNFQAHLKETYRPET